MISTLKKIVNYFKKVSEKKTVKIISHYDTDGITAAAIAAKALQREGKFFSIRIIRQLDLEAFDEIRRDLKDEVLLILDLGSNKIKEFNELQNEVFILDHHEINNTEQGKVKVINPHLFNYEAALSGAALSYLFSLALNEKNKDLASLAVIGMVGDMVEKELGRISNEIVKDSDVIIRKGPLLFSSTRPIHKALEFSSEFFIPGVTGSQSGVTNLLREAGIKNERYSRTLLDLNEEEMSCLVTNITLRRMYKKDRKDIIGNIYLLKFFNRLEDVRELSTLINACSRLGYSDIALAFCLGDAKARIKAESIYNTYKHEIIKSLNFAERIKLEEEGFVLINAGNNIKDSVIGTIVSIIASSFIYGEGTIIIGMTYRGDKIKVSTRIAGESDINLQKVLSSIMQIVGGEVGGHARAAGCLFSKDKEEMFINELRKEFEGERVKIKVEW